MSSDLGSVIEITPELQGYFAGPRLKSGRRMGITVVHDVLGFADSNCRYVVDHWASRGFEALMPNCFEDLLDLPEEENISTEKFLESCLLKVDHCIALLQEEGCVRFGIIGLGWGGLIAERVAGSGSVAAAVSVNCSAHSAATYKMTQEAAPESVLLYVASDDSEYSSSVLEEIAAAGGKAAVFQDRKSELAAAKGTSDDEAAAVADEILLLAEKVFCEACLKKSSLVKLGTLHPDAQGINVRVKVLEEPRAVERNGVKFFEVLCGDETSQVVLSLKEAELTDALKLGQVVTVRSSCIQMVEGFMRLALNKGGRIDTDKQQIEKVGRTNLSKIEQHGLQASVFVPVNVPVDAGEYAQHSQD